MNLPDLKWQHWYYPFMREGGAAQYRWLILFGGRAGAKTWLHHQLALRDASSTRMKVLCIRETWKGLELSSKAVVDEILEMYPQLARIWTFKNRTFTCKLTGSEMSFHGMSEQYRTSRRIRSAQGINRVIIDEGQYITEESLRHLGPTIRTPGAQFYVSLNPELPDQPLYEKAVGGDKGVLSMKVGWQDNPFLPQDYIDNEILVVKERHPERYAHEYGGELLGTDELSVLPYTDLKASQADSLS